MKPALTITVATCTGFFYKYHPKTPDFIVYSCPYRDPQFSGVSYSGLETSRTIFLFRLYIFMIIVTCADSEIKSCLDIPSKTVKNFFCFLLTILFHLVGYAATNLTTFVGVQARPGLPSDYPHTGSASDASRNSPLFYGNCASSLRFQGPVWSRYSLTGYSPT